MAEAFDRFREQQTIHGGKVTTENKRGLKTRLSALADELDRYLAREYGIDLKKKKAYADWKASHQPFHWFAEFHGVMEEGGFDVVIGNPPYIQLKEISDYRLRGYDCIECGNIYPVMLERCLSVVNPKGKQGFIVPVSSISTDGYKSIQDKYRKRLVHVSCYDDRPSRLFDGLEHIRLVVFLISQGGVKASWHSTKYHKWNSQERDELFERLVYMLQRFQHQIVT